VRAGKLDIALFLVNGEVHAIENRCPHTGSALDDGWVSGQTVMCVAHGWTFDLPSGCRLVGGEASAPMSVATVPVRVEGDVVVVSVATPRPGADLAMPD
jgi:3-phenylpropionate/trans-cinnamate dioxygenase ferredoxin subunit